MARIRHIEFAGRDGAGLRDFYRDLFDWEIRHQDRGGFDYYDLPGGTEFSAGIRDEPEGEPEIVVYVQVADVDLAFERALQLGATERIAPMDYGDLRFALITDPEGNPLGLTQSPQE